MNNDIKLYSNQVVDLIKRRYSNHINKVVIFGNSLDNFPEKLNIAVGLINENEYNNFDLLGELLSEIADIIKGTNYDCDVYPIHELGVSKSTMAQIEKGVVVYEYNKG